MNINGKCLKTFTINKNKIKLGDKLVFLRFFFPTLLDSIENEKSGQEAKWVRIKKDWL